MAAIIESALNLLKPGNTGKMLGIPDQVMEIIQELFDGNGNLSMESFNFLQSANVDMATFNSVVNNIRDASQKYGTDLRFVATVRSELGRLNISSAQIDSAIQQNSFGDVQSQGAFHFGMDSSVSP